MPNRRNLRGCPRAQLADGVFPHGPMPVGTPLPVIWAAEIARRLEFALANHTITRVAAAASVGRQTIYDIIRGTTWPDLVTIVQLQEHLGVPLLPAWLPTSSAEASERCEISAKQTKGEMIWKVSARRPPASAPEH